MANTLICLYHGFSNKIKLVLPHLDSSTTIDLDKMETILNYIEPYNIEVIYLDGMPQVIDPLYDMLVANFPEITIRIGLGE